MTVIEALRAYFKKCPFLDLENNPIGVDYLGEAIGDTRESYALNVLSSDVWHKRYVDGGGIKNASLPFSLGQAMTARLRITSII